MIPRFLRVLRLVVFLLVSIPEFLTAFCGSTRFVSSSRLLSSTDSQDKSTSFERMTDLPLTRKADNHPVKVLGICGGIGSGKSAACKLLVSQLNALVHIGTEKR
jgi:polynucleotide 5'-kinase involved in rRNA processing